MRIVVISDTHIHDNNCQLPARLKSDMEGADMIIHAGDYVSAGFVDCLKKYKNFYGVSGNMDSLEIKRQLPDSLVVSAGKFKIGIMHGIGSSAGLVKQAQEKFKDVDAVIFGHSHSAVNEIVNGVLYFNPGSPTEKFFAAYNSYGILDVGEKITPQIIRIEK